MVWTLFGGSKKKERIGFFFEIRPKSKSPISFGRKLSFLNRFRRLKEREKGFQTVKSDFQTELSTERYGRFTFWTDFEKHIK